MIKTAYNFVLLPGSVQIYYGDETSRVNDMGGGIDLEQGIRSDMNFPEDIDKQSSWASKVATLSTEYSKDPVLAMWQKVGQFRLRNIAVGAGYQEKLSDNSYCRSYKDPAKGVDNAVVIHVGDANSVQVGKCFADGTVLQDANSGKSVTVKDGKVDLEVKRIALLEIKR